MEHKLLLPIAIGTILCIDLSYGQNIAVNTTGTAAASTNMFEVTQASATNNTVGIFSSHTGTAANAYAIWAEATGTGNKYALVVPYNKGSVGIGTITPSRLLHIRSTPTAAEFFGMRLSTDHDPSDPVVEFYHETANKGYRWRLGNAAASSFYLDYSTTSFASNTPFMTVLNSGYFGIAATTPGSVPGWTPAAGMRILEITGDGSASMFSDGVLMLSNNRATSTAGDETGAVTFDHKNNPGNHVAVLEGVLRGAGGANGFGGALSFWTKADNVLGHTQRMILDHTGYLGIGTTSPQEKLHVHGANSGIRVEDANVAGNLLLLQSHNVYGPLIAAHTNSAGNSTYNGPAHQIELGTTALIFKTSPTTAIGGARTFTEHMRMDNSGNVGIGTTTPLGQLHISIANQASFLMSDTRTAGNQVGRVVYDGGTVVTGGGWVFQKMTDAGAFTSNLVSIIQNTGNVGIGTIVPGSKLHVSGGNFQMDHTNYIFWDWSNRTIKQVVPFGHAAGSGSRVIRFTNSLNTSESNTDGGFEFTNWNESTVVLKITDYKVGIGTASPSQALHVVGNICYTGSIAACSDIRYKMEIKPLTNSLGKLLKLQGVSYFWRTAEFPENKFVAHKQIGFIAQDIEKLFPEVVQTNESGFKSVDYSRLTPLLVEALKEQQKIIDELTRRINALEAIINSTPPSSSSENTVGKTH